MLFMSLIVSAVLLLAVNLAARKGRASTVGTAFVFILCGLGFVFAGCLLPAVALQSVLLVACAACFGGKPRAMAYSSLGATAAVYALAFVLAYQGLRHYDQLREQYAFES